MRSSVALLSTFVVAGCCRPACHATAPVPADDTVAQGPSLSERLAAEIERLPVHTYPPPFSGCVLYEWPTPEMARLLDAAMEAESRAEAEPAGAVDWTERARLYHRLLANAKAWDWIDERSNRVFGRAFHHVLDEALAADPAGGLVRVSSYAEDLRRLRTQVVDERDFAASAAAAGRIPEALRHADEADRLLDDFRDRAQKAVRDFPDPRDEALRALMDRLERARSREDR